MVRNHFGVAITHRDGKLKIVGEEEPVELATSAIESLQHRARQGKLYVEDLQETSGMPAVGPTSASNVEVNLAPPASKD